MAITGDDLRRICGAWIMLSEQAERDERQRILEIIAEAERTGDIDMVTAEMLVSRITVTPPRRSSREK